MNNRTFFAPLFLPLATSLAVLVLSTTGLWAKEPVSSSKPVPGKRTLVPEATRDGTAPSKPAAATASNRTPDEAIQTGLRYLLERQTKSGGWNQGGGWRQARNGAVNSGGRVEGGQVEDPADLGNTCVSLMALLRAGETPLDGGHREAAQKAFEFICAQVEAAEADTLWVTSVRDSQMQVKIGTYVDTFLTGWALSELKGKVAEGAAENRRAAALQKVVAKIEKYQKDDGSFGGNSGWAAVLSQGLASKALNNASRVGAAVSPKALARDNTQNSLGLDVATGAFSAPVAAAEPTSAGVSLYRETAKLNGLLEKTRSNAARRMDVERLAADKSAPAPVQASAQAELKQFDADEGAWKAAQAGVGQRAKDARFTAGFGNNGGEEFLSYMNLGEAMKAKGGAEWAEWKGNMQKTICAAQNEDGSWAGNHCITGRTFCTSAALMTLLLDRAPDTKLTDAKPVRP